jgi:hypothetical protein
LKGDLVVAVDGQIEGRWGSYGCPRDLGGIGGNGRAEIQSGNDGGRQSPWGDEGYEGKEDTAYEEQDGDNGRYALLPGQCQSWATGFYARINLNAANQHRLAAAAVGAGFVGLWYNVKTVSAAHSCW